MESTLLVEKKTVNFHFATALFFVAVVVLAASAIVIKVISNTAVEAESLSNAERVRSGSVETKSVFEALLKPISNPPVRLYTENKSIDLPLVEVGIESDGSLETPKFWSEGGWYKKGAKAGEKGNVIIDGHYDDNLGKPAAFWALKNVKVGDKVYLVDKYGNTYTYVVFKTFHVSINDPNRLDVLENTPDDATLTLITCGGLWLPGFANYSERLVVKATFIERVNSDSFL